MFKKISMQAAVLSLVISTMSAGVAIAKEVTVSAKTPFSESSVIREAIKNECQLESKLPEFVKSFSEGSDISVTLSDAALNTSSGQVLVLEIVGATGGAGGAFSGSKSVQVSGKLFDNGKEVGNFSASRYSGGGMFAAYKGTCSILGRCVKTLGKDIATWMQNPTKDAHLGDL